MADGEGEEAAAHVSATEGERCAATPPGDATSAASPPTSAVTAEIPGAVSQPVPSHEFKLILVGRVLPMCAVDAAYCTASSNGDLRTRRRRYVCAPRHAHSLRAVCMCA